MKQVTICPKLAVRSRNLAACMYLMFNPLQLVLQHKKKVKMKSTFSILFYLKRNGQKANGNMPIMGRITVNGQAVQFGTKVEIKPDCWNVKVGKVIGKINDVQ